MQISRRSLFTQVYADQVKQIRPPGALSEQRFIDQCTRCLSCVEQCPEQIIQPGEGGFPILTFESSGCTGCGECITVCAVNALTTTQHRRFPELRIEISNTCMAYQDISCQACKDSCDTEAIQFPMTRRVPAPIVHINDCIGCGQCIAVCPNNSIQPIARTL